MGTVDLPENIPGVDEEHRPILFGLWLCPVEEPESAGQGYGVEEVRTDTDEDVNRTGLDELLPDLHFRSPGISGRVGHHEPCPAFLVQRVIEDLDPEVVCVISRGDSKREPLVILHPLLIHPGDIEGGIGHHKIELPERLVRVLVVGIRFPDISG